MRGIFIFLGIEIEDLKIFDSKRLSIVFESFLINFIFFGFLFLLVKS